MYGFISKVSRYSFKTLTDTYLLPSLKTIKTKKHANFRVRVTLGEMVCIHLLSIANTINYPPMHKLIYVQFVHTHTHCIYDVNTHNILYIYV